MYKRRRYNFVQFSLSFSCKLRDTRKMDFPLFHNRICKVCTLVAATLILPALAYAQNNQDGDAGPGIKLGTPNGTYVFTITGYLTDASGNLLPLSAAGRETYFGNGSTSGVTTFSIKGQVQSRGTFTGTFTVNADGSVSETDTQVNGLALHFHVYPTPDGNTFATIQTDPGAIASGFGTRGPLERD